MTRGKPVRIDRVGDTVQVVERRGFAPVPVSGAERDAAGEGLTDGIDRGAEPYHGGPGGSGRHLALVASAMGRQTPRPIG